MRTRWIAAATTGTLLSIAAATGFRAARGLFQEPGATRVPSVIGEIGGTRVLGVFAHPDDEQTVNGLFWRAKDRDGAFTAMITATSGEAGHQVPVVARTEDLGIVRAAEALKNSFNLGVDEHEVWDYPDGGVPGVDEQELVDRLVAAMKRIQPDVVVGFWPGSGATGHKDHMQIGKVTELAIAQLTAEGGEYGGPSQLVYTISPTKALGKFGGERGKQVVENQPAAQYAMPAEVGKKHEGWAIHASQAKYLKSAYSLPAWVIYALWNKEFYTVRDLAIDPIA